MGQIITLLIPTVVALAIFGVFLKMSLPKREVVSIESRLATFAERPAATLEELELDQPFYERVIKPIVAGITRKLGKMTPAQGVEKLRTQLVLAGNPYNMGTAEFSGMRIMAAVLLGIAVFPVFVC